MSLQFTLALLLRLSQTMTGSCDKSRLSEFLNTAGPGIKLRALSQRENYAGRATAACQCQLLRIEGVAWSAQRILSAVFSIF
jgi:hypothetical protein